MQWYAIFVETGEEENLRKFLEIVYPEEKVETLIPKRKLMERRQGKVYERVKRLFPGYVLIKADMNVNLYYKMKNVPKVLSIIKNEGEPIPIPEEEMALIVALTRFGEVIDFSQLYREGSAIKVLKGPLEGLEGIIEKFDHRKKRVKVCLEFLGQKKRVDLGADMVACDPS